MSGPAENRQGGDKEPMGGGNWNGCLGLQLLSQLSYLLNQRGQTTRIIGTERTKIKISSGNPMRQ